LILESTEKGNLDRLSSSALTPHRSEDPQVKGEVQARVGLQPGFPRFILDQDTRGVFWKFASRLDAVKGFRKLYHAELINELDNYLEGC